MSLKIIAAIAAAAMAMGASACQAIPDDMTVAQYCAQPDKTKTDICKINVEIDGQQRALADTNMSLAQARTIADSALARANSAQASADAAMTAATEAKTLAAFNCTTTTVNKAKSRPVRSGLQGAVVRPDALHLQRRRSVDPA